MIPFLDLKAAYDALAPALEEAILRASRSGWYIGGSEVEMFEHQFAAYVGAKHCVGLGNGLDALTLALRALEVGPGDEVIVPSNTFIATWLAVSAVGAIPVPVEPKSGSSVIDVDDIAEKLSSRTKAIMPVHLYGIPADMNAICALAKQHQLFVVEDAAQAHGAEIYGQHIGAHGDVVAWSFYPGKNLGALGDGGAVTTNNADLAKRIRRLGNYGSSVKYHNEVQGVNSRLDPIQAAVLSVKLAHLDDWNQRRSEIALQYIKGLSGLPLRLPQVPDWATPAWHLFVIATEQREALQTSLQTDGIQTLIHYPVPPHQQQAYPDYADMHLPQAENDARQVLSLPIGPQLSQSDVGQVIKAVCRFYKA